MNTLIDLEGKGLEGRKTRRKGRQVLHGLSTLVLDNTLRASTEPATNRQRGKISFHQVRKTLFKKTLRAAGSQLNTRVQASQPVG